MDVSAAGSSHRSAPGDGSAWLALRLRWTIQPVSRCCQWLAEVSAQRKGGWPAAQSAELTGRPGLRIAARATSPPTAIRAAQMPDSNVKGVHGRGLGSPGDRDASAGGADGCQRLPACLRDGRTGSGRQLGQALAAGR